MRTWLSALSLVWLVASLNPSVTAAQAASAHPLVGTWTVAVPAGMRVGPNGAEAIRATGTLVVTQEGDSLIGMLDVDPSAELPTLPARRFAGLAKAGTVQLERRSTARLTGPDGAEHGSAAVTILSLTVEGDRLTGTQDSSVEGIIPMGSAPQPVSGTRRAGN